MGKIDIRKKFHYIYASLMLPRASRVALVIKNPPANAGDLRDTGSILGGGHGSPLQYSCLKNPMDQRSLVGSPMGSQELDTA